MSCWKLYDCYGYLPGQIKLSYSEFGAVEINIKCTAADVLTIIYPFTNLFLLVLGKKRKKQNQTIKQLRAQSNSIKIKINMALGLMRAVSASGSTQWIPS